MELQILYLRHTMIDILFVHTNSVNQTFQSLSKYAAVEPPIWAALLANSIIVRES